MRESPKNEGTDYVKSVQSAPGRPCMYGQLIFSRNEIINYDTRRVRKVKIQRSYTCTTFLIYKSDTVNELHVHNFVFQHEPRRDFFLHLIIVVQLFLAICFFRWKNKWKSLGYHKQQQLVCEFPLDVHLLRWEIVWRNASRIWWDFGSALPFKHVSLNAGSTTVKRARFTGKGSSSKAGLP